MRSTFVLRRSPSKSLCVSVGATKCKGHCRSLLELGDKGRLFRKVRHMMRDSAHGQRPLAVYLFGVLLLRFLIP